jgi:hypothetical protein
MPVTLELVENGRVMFFTFTDPWDTQELMALYPRSAAYLDQAKHKLHTLTDVRNARRLPSRVLDLRRGPDWAHPNSGHVAIVGAITLVTVFAQTIFKLTRFERVQFFNTMDDAWAFLRKAMADEDSQPPTNPANT